jgi:hypothetical protein
MIRPIITLLTFCFVVSSAFSERSFKLGFNAGLSQPMLNFGSKEENIEKSGYAQTGCSFEADLYIPTESKNWQILISCLYNSNSLNYSYVKEMWKDVDPITFLSSNSRRYHSITPLIGLKHSVLWGNNTEFYLTGQLGINILSMSKWEDKFLVEEEWNDQTVRDTWTLKMDHDSDRTPAFSVAIGLVFKKKIDLKIRYLNTAVHLVGRSWFMEQPTNPFQQRTKLETDSLDRSVSILMLSVGYII